MFSLKSSYFGAPPAGVVLAVAGEAGNRSIRSFAERDIARFRPCPLAMPFVGELSTLGVMLELATMNKDELMEQQRRM